MEGKSFLEVAQKLAQMRTEPALRSAISRAYYAAYNCSIQLVGQLGFQFGKDAPAHEKIYQYLRNTGLTEMTTAADDLKFLRLRRNRADYAMESNDFQNHIACQFDLVRAQAIITQIGKYSKEPLRAQLRDGLRIYQAKISEI